jgi:hypothetical protein
MDDSDDNSSPSPEVVAEISEVEQSKHTNEIVEDLTGEVEFLSDEGSLDSLNLNDGAPAIIPRAYQIEMVEESLKRNIIVAVS